MDVTSPASRIALALAVVACALAAASPSRAGASFRIENCRYLGIDIEAAVEAKTKYNRTRPHRHGGKRT